MAIPMGGRFWTAFINLIIYIKIMQKRNFKNQIINGFTIIELLIVIAIISILSVVIIVNVRTSERQDLVQATEQLVADIKYVRNLAVSRVEHHFTSPFESIEYPPVGYGIYFNWAGGRNYIVYADRDLMGYQPAEDSIIKMVNYDNKFELSDNNSENNEFYFIFITENDIRSNMTLSDDSKYELKFLYQDISRKSIVTIGEESDDGYVWTSIGAVYGVNKEYAGGMNGNGNGNCGSICPSN